MNRLKTNRNLANRRPRCFLGAVIGAVGSIAGSIIGSNAQRRERRRQERAQDYTNMLETAKSDSAAMNSMLDYNKNYLSQFNTVARLGTSKRRKLNSNIFITDGGDAVKIDKDTYLLRGGSHEQTNETGQTGIGINVGGNEVEAEGGEVAQKKNGALRIFSAQPILGNGMSPAQAILRGYNKDSVFNAQQQFKKRNGLKDDGSKARHGTAVPYSRIHINDDGTFTDTLDNKNYTTSATNGEDVVITGKANRWKEAGKRLNSKYIIPSSLPEMAKRIILNKMDNWVDRNVFAPNNYKLGIIRNKLFYNLNPEGYAIPDENALPIYPEKRIKDALSDRNKGRNLFLNGTVKLRNPIYAKYLSIDSIPTEYGGKAAVNDILTKSKYQPTKGNEHNDYYKSTNDYYDEGDYTTGPLSDTNLAKALQYKTDNKKSTFVMPNTYDNVMGAYTVSFGKDRKGKYMSYYDKWDLNPFEDTVVGNEDLENRYNIGKAVHLYNRRYYTDKDSINVMNKYRRFRNGFKLGGGLTSKDRGSSKHPYPSVSSKDFAGGGRSYPIPTKADAVDALRLAGLHGRSDVKAKVYSRYPELRKKARNGGNWTAPVYNTNKYRVSNRMRRQIATWEGSDFAGQNRKFKGDAIGAKERELRQLMGRTYNYLIDNQRDSLNSIYYNSRVDTFKNNFNKWFRNLNDAVDRGDERAFNNSLAGIRQSMNIGANRKGMSGLAKRRAWEQDWFGNPIPMDSNKTKAILKQQADARMTQPVDNTRVVIQPQYIEVPTPVGHGIIPVDNPNPNLLQGNIKDNLINMGTKFRLGQRCGGSTRVRKALGGESRPVKGMRRKLAWGDVTYPYRRNNDFDYWTVIDQEQKANDKGGITPWTTSNKYDVKPPLAITKTTPTIPYQSVVTPVTTKSKEDNGGSNNKSTNKLGATFKNVDWASLGADLIGTIGAGIIGAKTAGNIYIPDAPVRYQASKLDTNYNIVPQLETIRRSRNRLANEVVGNTSSSVAAINRLNLLEANANEQLNKLYDTKENRESELLNQDALNQQSVNAQNVQAMNDYNYRVAELKNLRTQGVGNVLSGTLQGIGNSFQNFFSQGRQNYDDTQAMLMGVAASDYATPSRLLELGVDVGDDAALAGIYHSAMNIPNPGARPKREDYSDNTEYSYALTRWENQNKAYQRRNSYADLIKGRMSRKNLSKYGII